jgi:hypothetical protein
LPVIAVQDLELEVLHQEDFALAVAVDVVDLERRVAGQESVARVGLPDLPEHLAVQRHRRQAAALDEVAAVDLGDDLGEDHLGHPVAVQVAEAHVAARSEERVSNFFQSFGFGFSSCSERSSSFRFRIRAAISSFAVVETRKSAKRAGHWAISPTFPERSSSSSAEIRSLPST